MAGISARAQVRNARSLRTLRRGGGQDLDARSGRKTHREIAGRDFLDASVHGPRALLELELSPFDLELPGELLLFLQLDVELARLMLRGDERKSARDQNDEEHEIDPRHAATSATRMIALRARGFAMTSA